MITDESLGLKVAEDRTEALWSKIEKEAELLIAQSEDNLFIQREMLNLAKEKLKTYQEVKI